MTRYEAQRMAAEDAYDAAHRCDCGGLYEYVCSDAAGALPEDDSAQQCGDCLTIRGEPDCPCEGCADARQARASRALARCGEVLEILKDGGQPAPELVADVYAMVRRAV
jgi:hypothetical protein